MNIVIAELKLLRKAVLLTYEKKIRYVYTFSPLLSLVLPVSHHFSRRISKLENDKR